jgi:hypothetical protein
MFVEKAPLCVPGKVMDWLQLADTLPPSLGPQNIVIVGAASPMDVTAPWSVAVVEVIAVAARLPTVAVPVASEVNCTLSNFDWVPVAPIAQPTRIVSDLPRELVRLAALYVFE